MIYPAASPIISNIALSFVAVNLTVICFKRETGSVRVAADTTTFCTIQCGKSSLPAGFTCHPHSLCRVTATEGPALARCCGYHRVLLHNWMVSAAFPRQRHTVSSTLAAHRVSLYSDSSDRNLADDRALNLQLLCLGNQSCRKHSALLNSLYLNKTCKEFGRC